jgi:hypothetical protein
MSLRTMPIVDPPTIPLQIAGGLWGLSVISAIRLDFGRSDEMVVRLRPLRTV